MQWVDDGTVPLPSEIGVSTVGLYTGEEVRVLIIAIVDIRLMISWCIGISPNNIACECKQCALAYIYGEIRIVDLLSLHSLTCAPSLIQKLGPTPTSSTLQLNANYDDK